MKIYFSGIGGVGIGPLAQTALDAGYQVVGSDLTPSKLTDALAKSGAQIYFGQTGDQIAQEHSRGAIDWFVYTSALPADHPELAFAKQNNIRASKRDELLAEIIKQKNLKLIAVAGTHGKTTTTGMLIWCLKQLGLPVSYSVGTTISYGPSGQFAPGSEYFVYECDEFDRNMLHFWPYLSVITSLDYDHFETYPTQQDYQNSFVTFLEQSGKTLLWERDLQYLQRPEINTDYEAYDNFMDLGHIKLPGQHNRQNAYLVSQALAHLLPGTTGQAILQAINSFPGTSRRFEKLADNLYTDYAHHPAEIAATLQMAHEVSPKIAIVYQPHQNRRQLKLAPDYAKAFATASKVIWLPTFLSREDPAQQIATPQQMVDSLGHSNAITGDLNDQLWQDIDQLRQDGYLVVAMSAGDLDGWLRKHLA